MNKVIKMTQEIWNLPAGSGSLVADGKYCALGKIAKALDIEVETWCKDLTYLELESLLDEGTSLEPVFAINDQNIDKWIGMSFEECHEIAIRTGIELFLAAGCTLETDDTVSKELAKIKDLVGV